MKTKHEVIIYCAILFTLFFLFTGSILHILTKFNNAFWFLLTGIALASLTISVIILFKSIVKYYVINYYGKKLYNQGKLKNIQANYIEYTGSLKKCCIYLNKKQSKLDGLIVDEKLVKKGKYINNKWRPIV